MLRGDKIECSLVTGPKVLDNNSKNEQDKELATKPILG